MGKLPQTQRLPTGLLGSQRSSSERTPSREVTKRQVRGPEPQRDAGPFCHRKGGRTGSFSSAFMFTVYILHNSDAVLKSIIIIIILKMKKHFKKELISGPESNDSFFQT